MLYGKVVLAALLTATIAAPLAAQDNDPTTKVTGAGLPDGWMLRFDPSRRGPAPTVNDVNFRTMGAGFHLTSGPAALYYRPADSRTGDFTVSATISQRASSNHEAYGLFIGGRDLQTPEQNYLYFIVHPKDGKFLINHRVSDARPNSVVPYTTHPAINTDDPATGAASNTLAIRVAGDQVHFMVNGQEVKRLSRAEIDGAATDGLVGLRLNHNLDVHIADFGVSP